MAKKKTKALDTNKEFLDEILSVTNMPLNKAVTLFVPVRRNPTSGTLALEFGSASTDFVSIMRAQIEKHGLAKLNQDIDYCDRNEPQDPIESPKTVFAGIIKISLVIKGAVHSTLDYKPRIGIVLSGKIR